MTAARELQNGVLAKRECGRLPSLDQDIRRLSSALTPAVVVYQLPTLFRCEGKEEWRIDGIMDDHIAAAPVLVFRVAA